MSSLPLTIIILTFNEEDNLAACLDSVRFCDDVHVLDSGSTDATVKIARSRGIPVHFHPFAGFGQQRNWAIDNIPSRHPWHFHLDADERFTPELADEIARVVASDECGGYFVPNKQIFAGKWLRYAGSYPTYQVRLFHRERLRFVDHGHGQREETRFTIGKLTQPYLHLAFSKGLDSWFAKHAVYARREAEQAWKGEDGAKFRHLLSRDAVLRRRALKLLTSRLPGRYFLRLTYMILIKRSFLDGRAGLIYAHMLATYEAMIGVYLSLARHGLKP